jgi:hypothetical protein
MIRSFADKMKDKQKAYEAKQKILAEEAVQIRLLEEEKEWEERQLAKQEKVKLILAEEEYKQEQDYIKWKQEQKILREQAELAPVEKIDTGVGMGHESTWKLTWKSFSTHPDIINLPMSEKVRLFKQAEQRYRDKLNYYANLHVDYWQGNEVVKGHYYWTDGIIDETDIDLSTDDSGIQPGGFIVDDVVWDNSVDINMALTINEGVTVTVLGILTVNASIINNGTLIVNGIVVKLENITNNGTLTIT